MGGWRKSENIEQAGRAEPFVPASRHSSTPPHTKACSAHLQQLLPPLLQRQLQQAAAVAVQQVERKDADGHCSGEVEGACRKNVGAGCGLLASTLTRGLIKRLEK